MLKQVVLQENVESAFVRLSARFDQPQAQLRAATFQSTYEWFDHWYSLVRGLPELRELVASAAPSRPRRQ